MDIVINRCFGGFSLSEDAIKLGRKLSGDNTWGGACIPGDVYSDGSVVRGKFWGGGRDLDRTDSVLIQVVRELGEAANGLCADLEIERIPAGTKYRITEYDGHEILETMDDIDWEIAKS